MACPACRRCVCCVVLKECLRTHASACMHLHAVGAGAHRQLELKPLHEAHVQGGAAEHDVRSAADPTERSAVRLLHVRRLRLAAPPPKRAWEVAEEREAYVQGQLDICKGCMLGAVINVLDSLLTDSSGRLGGGAGRKRGRREVAEAAQGWHRGMCGGYMRVLHPGPGHDPVLGRVARNACF